MRKIKTMTLASRVTLEQYGKICIEASKQNKSISEFVSDIILQSIFKDIDFEKEQGGKE